MFIPGKLYIIQNSYELGFYHVERSKTTNASYIGFGIQKMLPDNKPLVFIEKSFVSHPSQLRKEYIFLVNNQFYSFNDYLYGKDSIKFFKEA